MDEAAMCDDRDIAELLTYTAQTGTKTSGRRTWSSAGHWSCGATTTAYRPAHVRRKHAGRHQIRLRTNDYPRKRTEASTRTY
ncbi:hypothetical protein HRW08_32670 [Streptomyces lunaelactis]|nr:hypothetical protein [Streptomyces lunaelactis]